MPNDVGYLENELYVVYEIKVYSKMKYYQMNDPCHLERHYNRFCIIIIESLRTKTLSHVL